MNPRLIGLCSPAMESGKSTVAQHLVDQHDFVKVAFATPIKAMTEAFFRSFGMTNPEIQARVYGGMKEDAIPEIGVSSRRVQQTIGTEWGRQMIRDSIWTDLAMAVAFRVMMERGQSVVIDDLRFPNEFEAIHAAGGDCYRIVRPGRAVTVAHASEGQLDGIHMPEIWNTGSMDDLYAAADRALFA